MSEFANVDDMWDWLVERDIATHEELELVTNIFGYTMENLNKILYDRTGHETKEQYIEEEEE